MDGMDLGEDFTIWGLKTAGAVKECEGIDAVSYDKMTKIYFTGVTSGQLRDGLDDFYSDYKNRVLLIRAAVWLVLEGISGMPKEKLDKSIESWRSNAHSGEN